MNTSPNTVEDREHLKKLLVQPPVNKVDLHFPLGLEVTARNMKGVTIKDALEAIHKQFKKKVSTPLSSGSFVHAWRYLSQSSSDNAECAAGSACPGNPFLVIDNDHVLTIISSQQDDEIELPYLAGFEWDKEDSWTRLIVHQKKDSGIQAGGKKKKGKKDEEAA